MGAQDSLTAPTCAESFARPDAANHAASAAALASDRSTFAPGLKLLPKRLRPDVKSLYIVLRTLDDLVDEEDPRASRRLDAVEGWAQARHHAETPETRMLDKLSTRHEIPSAALLEFCAGMRHDIAHAPIGTEADLERYCQQAGGSVGVMLAHLLGTASPEGYEKMALLGRAMQRTNILRDIDEDALHGRHYIAHSTIERYGPPVPGQRAALVEDQIAKADRLYEQAADAPALLSSGQRAMALSATLYRQILRQIEASGYGRVPGTVTVPAWHRRLTVARHRLRLASTALR